MRRTISWPAAQASSVPPTTSVASSAPPRRSGTSQYASATVALAYWLVPLHLGGALEATLVVGGTLAACVLGHEFVRRVPVLRPLFGLKAKRPSGRPHPEALAVVGGRQ